MLAPICFDSSRMKATQNFRISLSDLPFGSKSAPPLPPPIFTVLKGTGSGLRILGTRLYRLTSSEGILEDLLEAQKLEDRQIHRRVESKTSLIGTQSRVKLHTVSPVDLHFSLVVLPDYSELDYAFGNGSDPQGGLVFGVLLEEGGVLEC